jgi:rod shape-determining protein MreC
MVKKKLFFTFFSIFLSAFVIQKIFFFRVGFAEKAASCAVYPIIRLSNFISKPIKKLFKNRRTYKQLLSYCQKLRTEREKLLHENIKLKALTHYAEKSADLREFRKRYQLEGALLAKVLTKTMTEQEQSMVVNRGTSHGIKKDMIAVYKFQLLGRVCEAFPFYSKIKLITDKQSKISAYANKTNTRGIVEGKNIVNKCDLKYISHLKALENDDLVFSSGQGLLFPEGFCLGKITKIKTKGVCHKVEIEPLIDLKSLEMCHLTNRSKMNLF